VEAAIAEAVPEVGAVHTHLEPLADTTRAERPADGQVAAVETSVERIVQGVTGERPRDLRFVRTDEGLVAFLTLGLEPERSLAQAHELGGEIRARIRRERPEIHDVFVHTEP
jgi:divalent metal cation (Fe/Co/Zn/Cd) transporter